MPNTYCPCPRPILKKQRSPPLLDAAIPTSPRDESAQLLGIDPSVLQPVVRFPPTNVLCRTFDADSPSIYDRSPIVVTPNKCKLPERGCPGRTYLPGDEATHSSSKGAGSKAHDWIDASGRHLHPRAVRVQLASDSNDEQPSPRMAGSYGHSMPTLVPDFSSSSESDESDGFSSPPLDCAPMSKCLRFSLPALHFAIFSYLRHAGRFPILLPICLLRVLTTICVFSKASSLSSKATSSPPGLSIPSQEAALYLGPISSANTPLPFRSRTFASFSRFPSHSTSPRSHSPCRDGAPSTSPTRRRRSHSKQRRSRQCATSPVSPSELEGRYKSFSERSALGNCELDVPDVGCLAGF